MSKSITARAAALNIKAAELVQLNPLMAAGQIKKMTIDLTALLQDLAWQIDCLTEENKQLKHDLAGLLPKGGR